MSPEHTLATIILIVNQAKKKMKVSPDGSCELNYVIKEPMYNNKDLSQLLKEESWESLTKRLQKIREISFEDDQKKGQGFNPQELEMNVLKFTLMMYFRASTIQMAQMLQTLTAIIQGFLGVQNKAAAPVSLKIPLSPEQKSNLEKFYSWATTTLATMKNEKSLARSH
jgi:hypothetical protein